MPRLRGFGVDVSCDCLTVEAAMDFATRAVGTEGVTLARFGRGIALMTMEMLLTLTISFDGAE